MFNEIIFFLYIITVSTFGLIALKIGKDALISLICLQYILVNFFVTKEITLFGLSATASDALAVGSTLSLNLLHEYHSKHIAQRTIWISFFCAIFYIVISTLHLAYIPAVSDVTHGHFDALLKSMPRIMIASLFVYIVAQHIDTQLYAYFRKKLSDRFFIIRNYGSVTISQFIDTVLFSFLGLYQVNESFNTINKIMHVIIVSYTIKLIIIAVAAPYLSVSKKLYIE